MDQAGETALQHVIDNCPLIDHHALPLLAHEALHKFPSLEVMGNSSVVDALPTAITKPFSTFFNCDPTWEAVLNTLEAQKNTNDYPSWNSRCLSGLQTVFIVDGPNEAKPTVPCSALSKYTMSPCKRIVCIENAAANIIRDIAQGEYEKPQILHAFIRDFENCITQAIQDPSVVGFASVILCNETKASNPWPVEEIIFNLMFDSLFGKRHFPGVYQRYHRIHPKLYSFLNDELASILRDAKQRKPIQLQIELSGTLREAPSLAFLEDFISKFPTVPMVLLNGGYPFALQARVLGHKYPHVYLDVGSLLRVVDRSEREAILRYVLQFCPSHKIMASADGRFHPEMYSLGQKQIREELHSVLRNLVRDGYLSWERAASVARRILFTNANTLYGLGLDEPRFATENNGLAKMGATNTEIFENFINTNTSVNFVRLYWTDYTAMTRMRIFPIPSVQTRLEATGGLEVGITKACFSLLQDDMSIPGTSPTGEYTLRADFDSLRRGPRDQHASMQGIMTKDGSPLSICPRTILQNTVDRARKAGLEFLVGFEVELVLLRRNAHKEELFEPIHGYGHSWSSSRGTDHAIVPEIIEKAIFELAHIGIHVEQMHPESAPGQFEVVLPKAPPLQAIDVLLHTREVICNIASAKGYRMTLHPKPFAKACGTASHVHLSISSPGGDNPETYEPFYAGILAHLGAVAAFTYSHPVSYERLRDSCWAGGRWVAWGTQNRETPLRRISHSHWEFKCLDGLANPYLALSAILSAGTHGVTTREALTIQDCCFDPATLTTAGRAELGIIKMLPPDISTALRALRADPVLVESMGAETVDLYVRVKEEETSRFKEMSSVQQQRWIFERY